MTREEAISILARIASPTPAVRTVPRVQGINRITKTGQGFVPCPV